MTDDNAAASRVSDYFRTHPAAAHQYEALKRQLAIQHAHDRNAYTDGKSAMVAAITVDARRWRAENERAQ
ncbi:GrpB family protein [Actinoplanes sp. NPDC051470]|uniref:GrpB family protein n=1 Tax=Actinoplanes sp. NPDC051470 TaxID=3157224 RepID=UPI003430EBEA